MSSSFNTVTYTNLDNFAKIPLNSSLLSNINENKSELILDENYIIEKLPVNGSLRYIENDFSIEHKFELNNNILKFKRIISKKYKYDKYEEVYVHTGAIASEPESCQYINDIYNCPSQNDGFGGNEFRKTHYFKYDTYVFDFIGKKVETGDPEDNIFEGNMSFNYTLQDGTKFKVGTNDFYVKVFKNNNFQGNNYYKTKNYHQYVISFFDKTNSSILDFNNPVDAYHFYYKYYSDPMKTYTLGFFGIVGLILVLILLYILHRLYNMLKYNCKINFKEIFFGMCGRATKKGTFHMGFFR